MKTVLDVNEYKFKINDIDTITWRPNDKKYGLFQQDKSGKYTVDVLHKYYNLPPYNRGSFNQLYESYINEVHITEMSVKDIIKKVKKRFKKFSGTNIVIKKIKDKYNIVTLNFLGIDPVGEILKNKYNKAIDVQSLSKEELKLILAYLWPHDGDDNNSRELTGDEIINNIDNSTDKLDYVYVDKKIIYYLMSGEKL